MRRPGSLLSRTGTPPCLWWILTLLEPADGRVDAGGRGVPCFWGRICPGDGVRDDSAHFRLMVDGIGLVAGTEVEDAPLPAREAAAGAEDFAACEGREKHQFVGLRNIEVFAVHLL